ncbi:MAG: class I SAM-dependent methyltransferase [Actinomycetota bacterium]|nr:MAG: class I SAM-dependent methyltransferase [Actinomycetota bacterium]
MCGFRSPELLKWEIVLSSVIEKLGLAVQRSVWTKRAETWDHSENPGLGRVIEALIAKANPTSECEVLDLGCGSGQLAIPVSNKVKSVIGVDISPRMIELLNSKLTQNGLGNVKTMTASIQELEFAKGSFDLILSNYALHHLSDEQKRWVVSQGFHWLKPNGRMVFGDMMFGRGGRKQDRQIIASKVSILLRKGPGGWWRIAKNSARYLARVQEKPISQHAWVRLFEQAGFQDIGSDSVVAEAGIVFGTKPG